MKKVLSLAVAFLFALAAFAGCANKKGEPKDNFTFPAAAQEEYERAYAANGGKAYDFATLKTFTLKQTISIYVPELSYTKAYPTTESREYLFDARGGVKSRLTTVTAEFNSDPEVAPVYTHYRKTFYNNCLCEPWYIGGIQQSTPVEPIERYKSYEEYVSGGKAFDTKLQNITAFEWDLFKNARGGVTEDANQYIITAQAENPSEFFDILAEQYDFKKWYAGGEDGGKLYNCFIDPQFIKNIDLTVESGRYGVISVTATVTATPAPEPYYGLTDDVTVTFETEYSTAEFDSETITANIKE